MSASCCSPSTPAVLAADPRWRRALRVALGVNAAMFALEIAASLGAGSAALLADAVDFGGDAANYALSLAALATGSLAWRLRAALVKGWAMALYGIGVLAHAAWSAWAGVVPAPATMGAVGLLALAANLGVAAMLFRFRSGDADMRSVWLCTRNDALGNLAVLLAALGVLGAGSGWPDQAVAAAMAALALSAGVSTIRQAARELREARAGAAAPADALPLAAGHACEARSHGHAHAHSRQRAHARTGTDPRPHSHPHARREPSRSPERTR